MTANIYSTSNPDQPKRLIRKPEVRQKTGLCNAHLYALIAEGNFPPQIKLVKGGRASAWLESEVDEWIDQRVKASRANNPVSKDTVTA